MARLGVLAAAIILPLAAGCQNNEQTGGLIGGAGGALACGVAGNAIFHSAFGTVLSGAACGAAGYFIGSAIGRQLDERDRTQAAAATQRALEATSYPTPAPGVSHRVAAKPIPWKSDHSGAHGSAAVVAVQAAPDGGECKTVREIAYIKGVETPQNTKYCSSKDGGYTESS